MVFDFCLFGRIVGDAGGGAVVGDDDSRRLQLAEFFKGDQDRAGFFTVGEEASKFSFGALETTSHMTRQGVSMAPLNGGGGSVGAGSLLGSVGRLLNREVGSFAADVL